MTEPIDRTKADRCARCNYCGASVKDEALSQSQPAEWTPKVGDVWETDTPDRGLNLARRYS